MKYKVQDYELTVEESVGLITREYAQQIMTSEDFEKWCKLTAELLERQRQEQEEYSNTHYFPGCYGDPLMDCN